MIVQKILSYTRGLTKKLQGIDRDLAKVMDYIKLLKETLKELRGNIDTHHAIWYQLLLKKLMLRKTSKENAGRSGTEITMTKVSGKNVIRNWS